MKYQSLNYALNDVMHDNSILNTFAYTYNQIYFYI